MDPDLVRQQAEAELEQQRSLLMAKKAPPKESVAEKVVFAEAAERPAVQTPMHVPPDDYETKRKPSRWRVYLQAVFGSSALVGIAALAGIAWGAVHGVPADEQLWLGVGAGVLTAALYGILLSMNNGGFSSVSNGH